MGVVGGLIAGLAAANAIAATTKNVAGAAKEVGEVINNAYEGGKKVITDLKDGGKAVDTNKDKSNYRRKRGSK